ncbi:MAG: iron ABC transporter permease [Halobacteriovoraceae bacterium]|nr:iron ABC transporter permease [Halobacteriovoraceae bacterium]
MNLLISILLLVLAILLRVFLGSEGFISPFSPEGVDLKILMQLRMPRAILGMLSGFVLGASGLYFQGIFRNNLASPYTLGVSSGAAFGASIGILLGIYPAITAFLGALLSIGFIFTISKVKRSFHPNTLILSGVIASFFFSSCIVVIHFFSPATTTQKIIQWTLGDLGIVGFESLYYLVPISLFGLFWLALKRMPLSMISVGDSFAQSRGVDTEKVRKRVFLVSSFLISMIVSFTGPIAFVGLIVPHLAKRVFGVSPSDSFWGTLTWAAIFLLLSDIVSTWVFAPQVLPVGVITSLLGAPFFLLILMKNKHFT